MAKSVMKRIPKELDDRLRMIQEDLRKAGLLNIRSTDVGRLAARELAEININVGVFKRLKGKRKVKGEKFDEI